MAGTAVKLRKLGEEARATPQGRRKLEEDLLIGDVTDSIAALLEATGVKQRGLAERLGVTEGRVSQILSGTGNLTLRTLGAVGWALGVHIGLRATPMADRRNTPAASDPAIPDWVLGDGGTAASNSHYVPSRLHTDTHLALRWQGQPVVSVAVPSDTRALVS